MRKLILFLIGSCCFVSGSHAQVDGPVLTTAALRTKSLETVVELVKAAPGRYKALCGAASSTDVYATKTAFWDFPDRYIWSKADGTVAQYNSSSHWYAAKDSTIEVFNKISTMLENGTGVAGAFTEGQFEYANTWTFPNKVDADKKIYDLVMKVYLGESDGKWKVTFLCTNNYKR